jgi:hypothetical protein
MINLKRLEQRVAKLETKLAPPPEPPPLVICGPAFESQQYLWHVIWVCGPYESWSADSGRELSSEVLASLQKHGYRIWREEVSGEVKWRMES